MPDAPTPTLLAAPRSGSARRTNWVPETRFGHWFLGTNVWSKYVVAVAIHELAEMLPADFSAKRILDAGSGPGVSLPLLAKRFNPELIEAIDIDPAEVTRSRQQARHCDCPIDVGQADATALPFHAARFDIVLCHQLLHHVVEQAKVLQELYRVLKPGGALLLSESCRSFILSWPVRALFRHPNHVQKSAAQYQELVRATGFEFGPQHVKTSTPFWSQLDWGLGEKLGWRKADAGEPTELILVGFKPNP